MPKNAPKSVATTAAKSTPAVKGVKIHTAKSDYGNAAHDGVNNFSFRGLRITRLTIDKKQSQVTVTVNGADVHSDTRGSKAVTAAQTLINEMIACKNARAKLLDEKGQNVRKGLDVADVNARLKLLDDRAALAIKVALSNSCPSEWINAAAPVKMAS